MGHGGGQRWSSAGFDWVGKSRHIMLEGQNQPIAWSKMEATFSNLAFTYTRNMSAFPVI